MRKSGLIKFAVVEQYLVEVDEFGMHRFPIWGPDALAKTEEDLKLIFKETGTDYVDICVCQGEYPPPDDMLNEAFPDIYN